MAAPEPELSYLAALIRAAAAPEERCIAPPAGAASEEMESVLLDHARLLLTLAQFIDPGLQTARIRETITACKRQSAILLIELGRVVPALAQHGIESIVLKGSSLVSLVYPAGRERHFSDLDIFVPHERFDEACELLAGLGYTPAEERAHPEFYERHHFHIAFTSRQGLRVELHWDLTPPSDYVRFDLQGIRTRAQTIDVAGVQIRTPSGSDHLLHLASQQLDLADAFSDLRRVVDVAFLLRAGAATDPGIVERAEKVGVVNALWALLLLTEALTGVAAPEELERKIRPGLIVRFCLRRMDLADAALRQFVRRHAGFSHLVLWLCAPSLRARAAAIFRFLLPTEASYLQQGLAPEQIPSLASRSARVPGQLVYLAKILGALVWIVAKPAGKLASPSPSR